MSKRRRVGYKRAPKWVEQTIPKGLKRRNVPSLLLISVPEEGTYVVASIAETEAVADPGSYLGRLLRPHAALLSLPYCFDN